MLDVRQKLGPYLQDIYSFGLIICEMMSGEFPSREDIANRNVQFYPGYTEKLRNLVYFMLSKDPILRPSIADILKKSILSVEMKHLYKQQIKEFQQ